MKPNVSELITLVQSCVQNNLIVRNRANIQNVLRNLSIESFKPNDDMKYSQDMIDNIQTLASGLLYVMFDPSHSSHIFYKMTSNTTRTNNQLTSEGRIRRVHGKHVFVSMGAQGVLWCGSKHVLLRDPDLN